MGYSTFDVQSEPTAKLLKMVTDEIHRRNNLISNGMCPYCGHDLSIQMAHGCKFKDTVQEYHPSAYYPPALPGRQNG